MPGVLASGNAYRITLIDNEPPIRIDVLAAISIGGIKSMAWRRNQRRRHRVATRNVCCGVNAMARHIQLNLVNVWHRSCWRVGSGT